MPVSKKYLGKYFILLDGRDFYGQWIGSEQSLPAKDSHEDGAGVYYYGPDDATTFESLRDALDKAMSLMGDYRIDILKCVDEEHRGKVCVLVPSLYSFWSPWGVDYDNMYDIGESKWFEHGYGAEKLTKECEYERMLFARTAHIMDA